MPQPKKDLFFGALVVLVIVLCLIAAIIVLSSKL